MEVNLSEKLKEKNQQIVQLQKELDRKVKEYEYTIADLREQLRKEQKKNLYFDKSSDVTKQVVKLAACGYNIKNIYDILTKERGIDIDLTRVKMIVDTVEDLPDELYQYYLKCKKEFKDNSSIDSGFFTSVIYKKYLLLENTLSAELAKSENEGDKEAVLDCVRQLVSIYDKMTNAFFKNGIKLDADKTVEEIMENYNENKEKSTKIINLNDINDKDIGVI